MATVIADPIEAIDHHLVRATSDRPYTVYADAGEYEGPFTGILFQGGRDMLRSARIENPTVALIWAMDRVRYLEERGVQAVTWMVVDARNELVADDYDGE